MRPRIFVAVGAAVLTFAASGDEFALGVRTTGPLAPAAQRDTFTLPPGFEIQLVAAEPDINKPMNMAFDAAGRLWVTTSVEYPWAAPTNAPGRDRLMIFEDFGPDGRARKVTEFAGGLNIPIGVYPFRNADGRWKAFVWSIPWIWLFEDTDGDGTVDKRTPAYGPFDYTRDTHGNQASFTRGFDGWIYATHGFNNDSRFIGPDGMPHHFNSGNTYRFRVDGARLEPHTWGQVNPFGLTWDERGNLYSSDCHSAPIYQLLAGGWYPSFGKPHDGLGFAPTMMEHAHGSTAIDGALYYSDDLWPEEYRDNLFIGNVMTSRLNRDRIEFHGSTPKAVEMPDFLTTTDPWFRPVHNILGPDGALYIADFYNRIIGHYEVPLTHPGRDRERGRIWRVVYRGQALRPAALPVELEGLIAELGSPNLTRRLLAMNEIQDRFADKLDERIKPLDFWRASSLSLDEAPGHRRGLSYAHVSSLWLRHRASVLSRSALESSLKSPATLVRTHALRILSEQGRLAGARPAGSSADRPVGLVSLAIASLEDPDALVRRCAAEALGAWPSSDNIEPLLEALAGADRADTHLVYILRKALRDQLNDDAIFGEVAGRELSDRDTRTIAGVAIAVQSAPAGDFLVRHRKAFADDAELSRTALQHAARYAPAAALDELAAAIQQESADDPDFQVTLLGGIRDGYARRGIGLTPALTEWTGKLALNLLMSVRTSAGWANEPIDDMPNPGNPWAFEERVQADTGKPARLLSSFPHGERATGRLVSGEFVAPVKLQFFLAGHDGPPDRPAAGRNFVRLREVQSGEVLALARPPRNDVAQPVEWNLERHAGRQVRLEIVDGDAGSAYAWLAFGRLQPEVITVPDTAPATVAQRQVAASVLAADAGNLDDLPELRRALIELSQSTAADVFARSLAARLVFPAKRELLEAALDPQLPQLWRTRIVDVVARESMERSGEFQQQLFREAPMRVQVKVVGAALSDAGAADYLVEAMETGLIPVALLADPKLLEKLRRLASATTQTRLQKLLAGLPEDQDAVQRLIEERRRGFDRREADAARGEQLYTQLCAVCHRLGGKGALVGPQLDGIGGRGVERLLEDILDPNRNVDHAFATTTLELKDGDTLSGLFRREEGAVVVLANAAGQEFTVPKNEITGQRRDNTSLMPANFGEALSVEQLRDLLGYLLGQ